MESHPLRMRGLKHNSIRYFIREQSVASFTDAWIETAKVTGDGTELMSHPLRMRGLKQKSMDFEKSMSCRILYGCVD